MVNSEVSDKSFATELMLSTKSFMYIKKSKGLTTEP